MASRYRRVSRASDKRAEKQFSEVIDNSDAPAPHADSHSQNGNDTVEPSSIGAETPAAAQQKADNAENNAKDYTDGLVNLGGSTADRPSSPIDYMMYFDTDLGQPIWYNGTEWVDATGTIV